MSIKSILRELRLEKRLSQKQVAGVLGMSVTGYASWEQGLSEPNLDAIRKLSKYYEVSADYLLELED